MTDRPAAAALVAVCGLCGGAGASTLAYLMARAAAREAEGPVLVCDAGGPAAGLAAYAGASSARSLPGLANAIAAHEPLTDGLFADDGRGLRVIASGPGLDSRADPDGLARVLDDARAAHALTVVDCGMPGSEVSLQVLEAATHVAWVLPATLGGIRRGSRVLDLFGVDAARRELVVARRDPTGRKGPLQSLAELAEGRHAPLVLVPHLDDLAERSADDALEACSLSLDAIRMALRA